MVTFRLGRDATSLVIAADSFYDGTGDSRIPFHKDGYMVLFLDGSVKFYRDEDRSVWNYGAVYNMGACWTELGEEY